MSTRINRAHLRAACDAHPAATYAELAALTGLRTESVGRIVHEEFGDARHERFVVVEELKDIRRGASFPLMQFLASAWVRYWPYGLRLVDGNGEVYEVRGFLRKHTLRQRLVGVDVYIEPVNCDGKGRRVRR